MAQKHVWCVWVWVQAGLRHCLSVEVRGGQFLLSLVGSGDCTKGCQVWGQTPLPHWAIWPTGEMGSSPRVSKTAPPLRVCSKQGWRGGFLFPDIQVRMGAAGRGFRLHQVICFTASSWRLRKDIRKMLKDGEMWELGGNVNGSQNSGRISLWPCTILHEIF